MDYYFTIESPAREEIKIEKSKFIASIASVSNKDEAMLFLNRVKTEFFDANHNCFAYKIGSSGMEVRSSDDGEPNGTAGKQILFCINKSQFSDIIIVVTRYFGGTKLGKGGLARAYAESANFVLSKCASKQIDLSVKIQIFCTYDDISIIKKLVSDYSTKLEEYYTDQIELIAYIPGSIVDEFTSKIITLTKARAGFKKIN
ncbi:MAG: YigZ family protein [Candidatus Kapabacteria bacterium]|nr:YigZ family protein [Candidatus Kapabacteria bacterium]